MSTTPTVRSFLTLLLNQHQHHQHHQHQHHHFREPPPFSLTALHDQFHQLLEQSSSSNNNNNNNILCTLGQYVLLDNDNNMMHHPLLNHMPLYAQRSFWTMVLTHHHHHHINTNNDDDDDDSVGGGGMTDSVYKLARRYMAHCDDDLCAQLCATILAAAAADNKDNYNHHHQRPMISLFDSGSSSGNSGISSSPSSQHVFHTLYNVNIPDEENDNKMENSAANAAVEVDDGGGGGDGGEPSKKKRRLEDESASASASKPSSSGSGSGGRRAEELELDLQPFHRLYKQQLCKLRHTDKRPQKFNAKQLVTLYMSAVKKFDDESSSLSLSGLLLDTTLHLSSTLNDHSLHTLVNQYCQQQQQLSDSPPPPEGATEEHGVGVGVGGIFFHVLLPRARQLTRSCSRLYMDTVCTLAQRFPRAFVDHFCAPLFTAFTAFDSQHFEIITRTCKVALLLPPHVYYFLERCVIEHHESVAWSDHIFKVLIYIVENMLLLVHRRRHHSASGASGSGSSGSAVLNRLLWVLSSLHTSSSSSSSNSSAAAVTSVPYATLVQHVIRAHSTTPELVDLLRRSAALVHDIARCNGTFLAQALLDTMQQTLAGADATATTQPPQQTNK